MTLPCYVCCEICASYETCNSRSGCEKCDYNVYGECTHPSNPALKTRLIALTAHRTVKQCHF